MANRIVDPVTSLPPLFGLGVDTARNMCNTVRMGQIRLEIPDELHRQLRIQALEEGITLRELVIRLLTERTKKEGN